MKKTKYHKSFDKTKIYYRVNKQKKPYIVFVHGLSGNFSGWKLQLDFFEKLGYSTLTYDLRGHGNSDVPKNKDYSVDSHAKDLYSLLKSEKIKEIILIGHCFGGLVIQKFYDNHPKKVKKLILINTSYKDSYSETSMPGLKFITKPLLLFYAILQKIVDYTFFKNLKYKRMKCNEYPNSFNWYIMTLSTLFYTHPTTVLSSQKVMIKTNYKKLIQKIKIPTLILSGRYDKFFPPQIQNSMHKLIKKSKLILIESKHLSILKSSKEVNNILLKFIKNNKI